MGVTDLDSGVNGQVVCTVPTHLPFDLKPSPDGHSYSLVTKSSLDKESAHSYDITVTARDLGSPARSSTKVIKVDVLDVNDNRPLFAQNPYTFYVVENNAAWEVLSASDADEGDNAAISYSLDLRAYDADIGYNGWLLFSLQEVSDHSLFGLDRYTGQIRTLRSFTETDEAQHKLVILVKDNGNVSLSATATVVVKVVEPKEAISAADVKSAATDQGENDIPFYLIITLGSVSTLFIVSIIVLVIMQCSKTTDVSAKYLPETNYDGTLCHSIQYRSGEKRYIGQRRRMRRGWLSGALLLCFGKLVLAQLRYSVAEEGRVGSVVGNVAKDLGLDVSALTDRRFRTVDFEDTEIYRLGLQASDKGQPPWTSEGRVIIKIKDVNDNNPDIEITSLSNVVREDLKPGSVVALISVTDRDTGVNGHLVTKVRAYDADIGYNGWLLFSLQEVSDHSLFGLDRYTGRIRTLRSFTETDEAQHKLVILVKDNGNVSLSATATVVVKLVEPKEAISAADVKSAATDIGDSGVTFYLMITLASVSTLFLISIIVLIAMQCSKTTDVSAKYLPETNYDGTLFEHGKRREEWRTEKDEDED
ncbi:hypothetical protein CRUP_012160 [Coryphaenoides rupestris]|nr:hypothetical protein CRUP_012160 [Coryphaenoides rupestris]